MSIKTQKAHIDISKVSLKYGDALILDNITFSIPEGDYVGIIGPNGSGKTSLLKLILGLDYPTSGSIKIFGSSPQSSKYRRGIGYVPQRTSRSDLHFPATVEEIVRSGRTPKLGILSRFSHHDRDAVEKAMQTTGVHKYRDRLIGKLSGGERQRVLIARALATEPKVLILDEPEAGIDSDAQEKFYDFLSELNKKFGLTIILVSHNIDVVAKEVKTIVCLNRRLICHGSIKDFMKNDYMQQLYGTKHRLIEHHH